MRTHYTGLCEQYGKDLTGATSHQCLLHLSWWGTLPAYDTAGQVLGPHRAPRDSTALETALHLVNEMSHPRPKPR